jgi:crotonobetainyl-CoA:carnitine CoA-transferase CaiB-like acyl-CoA transferase
VFQGANPGKRGITLDLTTDEGSALLHRLLDGADLLMENFSPRVMGQFGLTHDLLAERHPSLVVVRMPAFGLDGPWSERVGFALTMEALAGMATVTGHGEGRPTCPGGALDPIAGMHAAFAALLALAQREGTESGMQVEVPMIECALNVAAEPLLEHGAYGAVLERVGNRGRGNVLEDVYACAGEESWVAVTVSTAEQARALSAALTRTGAAVPDALADPERWEADRDAIADGLRAFFAKQDATAVVSELVSAGIAAGVVRLPTTADRNPHLEARAFYEEHHHPTLRSVRYPVLPTRFRSWIGPVHRAPAPTLGQHNDEVLTGELAVSPEELASLLQRAVVGTRPAGL